MSLESGYTATLIVDGPSGRLELVMETWEGGGLEGPNTKHRNAVTRKETARGGTKSRKDVTLTRECDAEVWAAIPRLEEAFNIDPVTAIRQPVDARNTRTGPPKTVTGKIGDLDHPNYDLSSEAVGMLTVVITADE